MIMNALYISLVKFARFFEKKPEFLHLCHKFFNRLRRKHRVDNGLNCISITVRLERQFMGDNDNKTNK